MSCYNMVYNEHLIYAMNNVLSELFKKHNRLDDCVQIKEIHKQVQMRCTTADSYYASVSSGYHVSFKENNSLIEFRKAKGSIPSDENFYCGPIALVAYSSLNVSATYDSIDDILKDIEHIYFGATEFFDKKTYVSELYKELRLRDLIFDLYVDIVKLEAERYNINLLRDNNTDKIEKEIEFNKGIIEKLEIKLKSYDLSNKILIHDRS